MVAIITDRFKTGLVENLLEEYLGDSHEFYIGLGASEAWDSTDTPPTPANTEREERLLRYKLQSVKKVLDTSLVVPRYNWTAGTTYNAYNDNSISQNQRYYVITEENQVYVCIRQGKDTNGVGVTSTVQPTGTSPTSLTELADGYVWKFLYTIPAIDATRFLTASFMPVQFIDSVVASDPYYSQYLVKNAATRGEIVGYRVTNAGAGYTTPGTISITITGNGKGAHAKATVTSSNTIGAIEVDESAGGFPFGSGYDYANVTISGGAGAGAEAVPIFGPRLGIGYNPVDTLRSRAINYNILADGTEEGVFVTNNDFRQLTLIRDLEQYNDSALFTSTTGLALNQILLSDADTFIVDQTITGGTSGAKAIVDFYDDSNTIWYHQTETTGFTDFTLGEIISSTTATANRTADSLGDPQFNPFSGDMYYIDNRNLSVTRSADQTEDVKVIIQL